MVLRSFLYENNYPGIIRPTKDIDANWVSDFPPTNEQIITSIQDALNDNDIKLSVSLYRAYGTGRSAGLKFLNPDGEAIFTMDMDINRPVAGVKVYTIDNFSFKGMIPEQMLADKITAISDDRVFRRIKDVIDLYYFSRCFEFDYDRVSEIIKISEKTVSDFNGFITRKEELRHAYEKFRIDAESDRPGFDEMYGAVKGYIREVLPKQDGIGEDDFDIN